MGKRKNMIYGMRRIMALLAAVFLVFSSIVPAYASSVPREETKNYRVAFYAFDCYHMQDENGRKYGYGYDMMQNISKYMQCTFSYVGYDKSAKECEDMLRSGEVDIYTAAKKTEEREKEFAFSKHPAITATTCMNVKRGNNSVVAGDYSTYNGLRIGLLARHTYNDRFIEFTKEKGFDCEIVYYDTPTELSTALVDGDVDALVNSYIRTPEDEMTVEDFGETPYYIMARKEDQALIDQIDDAIDYMNIETPNWRSDLYNQYYGTQNTNTELTVKENEFLKKLQASGTVIKAVMNPANKPYSWYEDGRGYGMAVDLLDATANELGLDYELIPVESQDDYDKILSEGTADICIDMDGDYEDKDGSSAYKLTDAYLTTSVSVLRRRGTSGKLNRIGVLKDSISAKEIVSNTWSNAQMIVVDNIDQGVQKIIDGKIDCMLLMSYAAQTVAREDTQNRLSVEVVPGASLDLKMGINANVDRNFYGIWEKTLAEVSANKSSEIVQDYLESTNTPSLIAYLFDRPVYFVCMVGAVFLILLLGCLYFQSTRTKNKQLCISEQLSAALIEARKATDAKVNFFSKMSHDIRTPLNVVLGMTQIARKYKHDPKKLDNALENITTEGNYLLTMINSILDVNQLEYGNIELVNKPFNPYECMNESIKVLQPLADKKEQHLSVSADFSDHVVVGDAGRFSQIMVNIVSNAIKYTDAGGDICVTMEALPDNRYRFTCVDNGIGMSPEFIQHICDDYSRAEDSRTSTTEGTGLGMAVVKGFTDLMGGTLNIESEPGRGSVFVVELPFAEPTIKERELAGNADDSKLQTGNDFKGKKVLLAEDNVLNAEIALELLHSIGLTVDVAENGEIAVQKYEASAVGEYYAIFMDMQMPVLDGIAATKKIRASKREDNDILIFAMTANTLARDQKNCRDAGMDGYISKPVNVKDIESVLRETRR